MCFQYLSYNIHFPGTSHINFHEAICSYTIYTSIYTSIFNNYNNYNNPYNNIPNYCNNYNKYR